MIDLYEDDVRRPVREHDARDADDGSGCERDAACRGADPTAALALGVDGSRAERPHPGQRRHGELHQGVGRKRAITFSAWTAIVATALGPLASCRENVATEVRGRGVAATARTPAPPVTVSRPVPRLVDLGAGKCIPCKAMAPILETLRTDYAGRLEVRFIDVWVTPGEAEAYRIRMIPTQIFYGADGRELARHEGFISREEILAQWKALGVEL